MENQKDLLMLKEDRRLLIITSILTFILILCTIFSNSITANAEEYTVSAVEPHDYIYFSRTSGSYAYSTTSKSYITTEYYDSFYTELDEPLYLCWIPTSKTNRGFQRYAIRYYANGELNSCSSIVSDWTGTRRQYVNNEFKSETTLTMDIVYAKYEEYVSGNNREWVNPSITNIPIFDSETSALAYFESGNTSGLLNPPTIAEDDTLALTGFDCDNTIHATWTGYTCDTEISPDDISIGVSATYFLELEPDEEMQDYDMASSKIVKYSDFCFERAYSEYMENNPYVGRIEIALNFLPMYYNAETHTTYQGQEIIVYFDKDGNIKTADLPQGSASNEFNGEFYLKNFTATSEFHNWDDSYIHCLWNGSSVDGLVDYNYSEIKVQIYACSGEYPNYSYSWIDYDIEDVVSINTNRLDFNLFEVDTYCQSFGSYIYRETGGWQGIKFRITPYYKTDTAYVNGKSVDITLSQLAGIDSIMQSTGNAANGDGGIWEDLEEDYFTDITVDSVIDDIFDNNSNVNTEDFLTSLPLNFIGIMQGFLTSCGQIPSMLATVFSFLPTTYSDMLCFGLIVVILLRILGR